MHKSKSTYPSGSEWKAGDAILCQFPATRIETLCIDTDQLYRQRQPRQEGWKAGGITAPAQLRSSFADEGSTNPIS